MILRTLGAALIAFLLDLAIATAALKLTRVPPNFPPFTLLPILSGTFFVTLVVFALSLGLPLRLSFTHSTRFAGVTPAAQMVLVLMHTVVAVVSFIMLTTPSLRAK